MAYFLLFLRWPNQRTKPHLKEINDRQGLYIVAELNNEIIGYARASFENKKSPFFKLTKIGHFDALCVLKNYRNQGIASKLRKAIERWLKQKKCSEIQLQKDVKTCLIPS